MLCKRDTNDPVPRMAKMQLLEAPMQDRGDYLDAYSVKVT